MIPRLKDLYGSVLRLEKSVVHGFASLLALRVVDKAAGLVLTVFLFRLLEKDQVANYLFVQTIVALCAVFGVQEFQNAISQSVARGFPGTYRKAVRFAFPASFSGSLVLLAIASWFAHTEKIELAYGFSIAAVFFPLSQGLNQWKGVLSGEQRFTELSRMDAVNTLVRTTLIIGALFAFSGSVLAPLAMFLLVPSLQNVMQTHIFLRRITPDAPVEADAITYGKRANIFAAISVAAMQLDRILIFILLSPAHLAIYMAAEKFASLIEALIGDAAAVLVPKFASVKEYTASLDEKLKIASSVMSVGVLLFAFFGVPPLVILIFGSKYSDAVIYAQILVGAVAVRNIATLRLRFIRSRFDIPSLKQVTLFSALARIASSAALIPLFGLPGAVASVLIHRASLGFLVSRAIKTRYLIG